MSSLFFLPIVKYAPLVSAQGAKSIYELCQIAEIGCKASGNWINRKIMIKSGNSIAITAEPGDWGNVEITLPTTNTIKDARLALYILAYSLHDLVAKESIKGKDFTKIKAPKGRKKTGKAKSNAERQKEFRQSTKLR